MVIIRINGIFYIITPTQSNIVKEIAQYIV